MAKDIRIGKNGVKTWNRKKLVLVGQERKELAKSWYLRKLGHGWGSLKCLWGYRAVLLGDWSGSRGERERSIGVCTKFISVSWKRSKQARTGYVGYIKFQGLRHLLIHSSAIPRVLLLSLSLSQWIGQREQKRMFLKEKRPKSSPNSFWLTFYWLGHSHMAILNLSEIWEM
jgi:hypothetical protein